MKCRLQSLPPPIHHPISQVAHWRNTEDESGHFKTNTFKYCQTNGITPNLDFFFPQTNMKIFSLAHNQVRHGYDMVKQHDSQGGSAQPSFSCPHTYPQEKTPPMCSSARPPMLHSGSARLLQDNKASPHTHASVIKYLCLTNWAGSDTSLPTAYK